MKIDLKQVSVKELVRAYHHCEHMMYDCLHVTEDIDMMITWAEKMLSIKAELRERKPV